MSDLRSSGASDPAGGAGRRVPADPGARGQRGAILLVVLILSLVSAAIALTVLHRSAASAESMGELVSRRRAFYAVDGMSRMIIRSIQDALMFNPNPSTGDLASDEIRAAAEVPGFTLERYEVASTGEAYLGPIPNGAFQGMLAHLKPISLRIMAREARSRAAAEVNLSVLLGQISMFQFFVFGSGYLDLLPGPRMTINPGRVHANGDLCFGSDSTLQIEHVTAAGRLLASDGRCRRNAGKGALVWDGSEYQTINAQTSSGCSNCAGTGLSWQDYALDTWNGHVQDSAHSVPLLRLPVSGVVNAQAGRNAAGVLVSNAGSTRLLLDPVQSGDASDVLSQRLAWKADIRILNGVWYRNDGTWPGQPIWSDHPGTFTTRNEEGIEGSAGRAVGQGDLRTTLGWTSVPRRYSHYEYNVSTQRLYSGTSGVVSYGTVNRGSDGLWRPGYWAAGASGQTYVDVDGRTKRNFCEACSGSTCTAARALRSSGDAFCQYQIGSTYTTVLDGQYLQATLGGLLDPRIRAADQTRGAILPINIDLAALSAALEDTTPGELGAYFDGGATFNGVIYVSATWSGSMAGMPDGAATLWPPQGGVTDATQVRTSSTPMIQRALPAPLCSDSLGYVAGTQRIGFSGPPGDGNAANGFEPWFTVPSCDTTVSPTARPNAIRLINGGQLDPARFPQGLTIATNLPAYVLGGLNLNSDTTSATSSPWMPLLIAADSLTLLSNSWQDRNAPWDNSLTLNSRLATSTAYQFQYLGGTVETADATHYSGGIENFPRFLENWANQTARLSTSFVVGFASVYQRQPWGASGVYSAPIRDWSFDPHLRTLVHQPPGIPLMSVYSASYLDPQVAVSDESEGE